MRPLLITCFLLLAEFVFCQATSVFTEANLHYKRGLEFYDQGIYGQARKEFTEASNLLRPLEEQPSRLLKLSAQLLNAKSAILSNDPEGEKLILDFTRTQQPDPLATTAIMEIADYYFNAKKYKEAIGFYEMVNPSGFSREERAELRFKQGYCHFGNQDFKKARTYFKSIKDEKSDFFLPTNYYYGLTSFYEKDYNDAISSFRKVEDSKKYQKYIPYYLCQIYFAQKRYDELIVYGEKKYNAEGVNERREIGLLLGQAYFEKKEYAKALPYFEGYAQASPKMRAEDFYQLAYSQYQTEHYDKAAENFEQLQQSENALGQNALFSLGDCKIRLGDKSAARIAFQKASELQFNKDIQEESSLQFAKLSYELGYDKDAIITLQKFSVSSKYYNDAQNLMADVFINTSNYDEAIKLIESNKNITPKMQEAYQKICLLRGMELLTRAENAKAEELFAKSLKYPTELSYKCQAYYWLAEIEHRDKQFNKSQEWLNKYTASTRSGLVIPEESSAAMADYLSGYNNFKQKKYGPALSFYDASIQKFKKTSWKNENIRSNIFPDAILRAGDCNLSKNNYNAALKYYDESIDNKYNGFVYALYQTALIKGLKGLKKEKISDLNLLVDDYPNSEYSDDALFELGSTNQDLGDNSEAKRAFNRIIKNFKAKSDLINKSLLRLGLIAYNEHDNKTAIGYYKQVLDNNPSKKETADALGGLEEIYVKDLGQPDEFIAIKEKSGFSISTATKDSVNYEVAENLYENNQWEKAALAYTNYITKFPKGFQLVQAYYRRGKCYFNTTDFDNAYSDMKWVVDRGNNTFMDLALGILADVTYKHKKDYKASYKYFTQLDEITTNEALKTEAQIGAMQSAYKLKDDNAVRQSAGKLTKNPKAGAINLATANFYLGKLEFDDENWGQASSYFMKSLDLRDEPGCEARHLLSVSSFELKNYSKAEEQAQDAIGFSKDFPIWAGKSIILVGDIKTELGDYLEASGAYEAVMDNFTEFPELVNEAKKKNDDVKRLQESKGRIDNSNNGLEFKEDKN